MSPVPAAPDPSPTGELTRWFAEEVQPHEPKIRAWLQARFPQLGDIDDLIQETYLRVLRAKGAGQLEHPKAYLFATARNAALDRFRRNRVITFERLADIADSSVLVLGADSSQSADRDHELEILAAAIRSLPERCREVLVLRKHHGLSHREIAERLGISHHTVNAQITVAMVKCREFFRAHGLLPPPAHERSSSKRPARS